MDPRSLPSETGVYLCRVKPIGNYFNAIGVVSGIFPFLHLTLHVTEINGHERTEKDTSPFRVEEWGPKIAIIERIDQFVATPTIQQRWTSDVAHDPKIMEAVRAAVGEQMRQAESSDTDRKSDG